MTGSRAGPVEQRRRGSRTTSTRRPPALRLGPSEERRSPSHGRGALGRAGPRQGTGSTRAADEKTQDQPGLQEDALTSLCSCHELRTEHRGLYKRGLSSLTTEEVTNSSSQLVSLLPSPRVLCKAMEADQAHASSPAPAAAGGISAQDVWMSLDMRMLHDELDSILRASRDVRGTGDVCPSGERGEVSGGSSGPLSSCSRQDDQWGPRDTPAEIPTPNTDASSADELDSAGWSSQEFGWMENPLSHDSPSDPQPCVDPAGQGGDLGAEGPRSSPELDLGTTQSQERDWPGPNEERIGTQILGGSGQTWEPKWHTDIERQLSDSQNPTEGDRLEIRTEHSPDAAGSTMTSTATVTMGMQLSMQLHTEDISDGSVSSHCLCQTPEGRQSPGSRDTVVPPSGSEVETKVGSYRTGIMEGGEWETRPSLNVLTEAYAQPEYSTQTPQGAEYRGSGVSHLELEEKEGTSTNPCPEGTNAQKDQTGTELISESDMRDLKRLLEELDMFSHISEPFEHPPSLIPSQQPELFENYEELEQPALFVNHEELQQPEMLEKYEQLEPPELFDSNEELEQPELFEKYEELEQPELLETHEELKQPELLEKHEQLEQPELLETHEQLEQPELLEKHEELEQPELLETHEELEQPKLFESHEELEQPELFESHEELEQPELFESHEELEQPELFETHEELEQPELFESHEELEQPELFESHEELEQPELFETHEELEQPELFESHEELEQPELFETHEELEQPELFEIHEELEQPELFETHEELEQPELFESHEELEQPELFETHEQLEQPELFETHEELEQPELLEKHEQLEQPELLEKHEQLEQPELLEKHEQLEQPELLEKHEELEQSELLETHEQLEQPELLEKHEQLEQPELLERHEQLEQPELLEKHEQLEQPELLERHEELEQPELLEKHEQLEQPELLERHEQLEQPELLEKHEQLEQPELLERHEQLEQPELLERHEQLEQLVQLQKPVQLEQPLQPTQFEQPELLEKRVKLEEPVLFERSVPLEPPVKLEQPVQLEKPVQSEEPVLCEQFVLLEPPLKLRQPVLLKQPVWLEPAVHLEPRARVEQPVQQVQPVLLDRPVHLKQPVRVEQPMRFEYPMRSELPIRFKQHVRLKQPVWLEPSVQLEPHAQLQQKKEQEPSSEQLSNNRINSEQRNLTQQPLQPEQTPTADPDQTCVHQVNENGVRVKIEAARQLAERLYKLEDIQRTEVVGHMDKDNEFSRAVGREYLKFFDFTGQTLDQALRSFLKVVVLIGESQERERVLQHFSERFQDCNPGSFSSSGSVLTLTCALMLLNTDLHGQNVGKPMSSSSFVSNLDGMNDGKSFHKDMLKDLYTSIKSEPLQWAIAEEELKLSLLSSGDKKTDLHAGRSFNPFQDVPHDEAAPKLKEGFLARKAHADIDRKRTPWGKRGWKTFYAVLKGLVLYLMKDQNSEDLQSAEEVISVHHSLCEPELGYSKRPHVFRLQTADWRVYLLQADSAVQVSSWISRINLASALYSSPPFAAAVGSQRKFSRPTLPAAPSKLPLEKTVQSHSSMLQSFREDLQLLQLDLANGRPVRSRELGEQRLREEYLQHETKRYEVYLQMLEVWQGLGGEVGGDELELFDSEVRIETVEEPQEAGLKKAYSSPSLSEEVAVPRMVKIKRNISERRTQRRGIIPRRKNDLGASLQDLQDTPP
ncbi:hypothetical protein GJAV_G00040530 [Gymnothorax javanicus]|nr:hypothetical protein GJAV_G00040530 [Gymnothorax javanicus]